MLGGETMTSAAHLRAHRDTSVRFVEHRRRPDYGAEIDIHGRDPPAFSLSQRHSNHAGCVRSETMEGNAMLIASDENVDSENELDKGLEEVRRVLDELQMARLNLLWDGPITNDNADQLARLFGYQFAGCFTQVNWRADSGRYLAVFRPAPDHGGEVIHSTGETENAALRRGLQSCSMIRKQAKCLKKGRLTHGH
jgi:hypothetical protein